MNAPIQNNSELIDPYVAEIAGHPLRRASGSGPSDIEWALLLQEFHAMKKALGDLIAEVKKFGDNASVRCENCVTTKRIEDHETRIRNVEQAIWKAMGIAAVVASLMSFFLGKIFK